MSPEQAWQQPILRLFDTAVGIAVGVACKWDASYAFYRIVREPVRWRALLYSPSVRRQQEDGSV